MQNSKYQKIFNLIRTDRDQASYLRFIERMNSTIFKTEKKTLEENEEYQASISTYLKENKIDENDKNSVEKELKDIRTAIENLNTINITLASYPNEKVISSISIWLDKNMEDKIVFDISIDPNIGAGAVFNNGIFKDYSLNKRIEEGFQAKRTEILSIIKN